MRIQMLCNSSWTCNKHGKLYGVRMYLYRAITQVAVFIPLQIGRNRKLKGYGLIALNKIENN